MSGATYSIADLRDIVVPEPTAFWPPARFVSFLLLLCLFALLVFAWKRYLSWKRAAYRRAGLLLLETIEGNYRQSGDSDKALSALSQLLKRVALAAFPRQQVAQLYGREWLQFLESSCPQTTFSGDPGCLLADVTVTASSEATDTDIKQLFALSRSWIRGHNQVAK